MITKVNLILIVMTMLFTLQTNAKVEYTPEQYLKNYALSTCVSDGYSSKEVKNDAAAAARGYVEFGDYSLSAHTAVRTLGRKFLSEKYTSQYGESMILAKCIDFYHSNELDELVKKFQGKEDN
ncbi:type VI secretion protein [Erwinia typographi]|uniref:Type VI secretion protein n=2 Tax=Erwinia typographi TaxID=371042 RepID=A0A0A4ABL3_9GAMM|nr:T6SS amidase immunity protein Tai4 family protein [Erwinia typographi]KGT95213.1 type VI secretion protein [Erwinia typographi]